MPNRTATFVSAILVASLAGLALIAESNNVAQAIDNCLSGPKGTPPQGGHWYYRVDRVTKRHCWYVGDAREKPPRISQTGSAPPNTAPQRDIATPNSVADARAEIPMPRTRVEPLSDVSAAQRAPLASVDAAQVAPSESANAQRLIFASRWPDQTSAMSSALETGKPVSDAPSKSDAASVAPAIPLAAADAMAPTRATDSIQTLLAVIVGALALAGIMGSVILRFGSQRSASRHDNSDRRRAIWDSVKTEHPLPPAYPRADIPAQRTNDPHDRREAHPSNDRVVEMLSRLSRSAAG